MAKIGEPSTFQDLINLIKSKLGNAAYKNVPTSGNAGSTEVVMGNDTRLSDSRTPTTHSHTVSQISDFPSLGTASAKNVPTSGNASSTEVVMGDDTRLTDSRTPVAHNHLVSDISDFPPTMPPSAHTHNTSDITDLDLTPFQTKALSESIIVDGVEITLVEAALNAINNKPTSAGDYIRDFKAVSFNGFETVFGEYIWHDGDDIFYSNSNKHLKFNKDTMTFTEVTFTGVGNFYGNVIWHDGDHTYLSSGANQYVFDKENMAWTAKVWEGLSSFDANKIWSDGTNIYLSDWSNHYVLDRETSTWSPKTWNGLSQFYGYHVWTDGTNIYLSNGGTQKVLDVETSTWSNKTWNGVVTTYFRGDCIWSFEDEIYFSNENYQYVLDKDTSTWYTVNRMSGINPYSGNEVWTDGENTYYSRGNASVKNSRYYDIPIGEMIGEPGGIATLNSSGRIPSEQTSAVQVNVKANTTPGANATIEGVNNAGTGVGGHTEGNTNTNSGNYNHVEGYNNTAQSASYMHVEGQNNTCGNVASHVEGAGNIGKHNVVHVEGEGNQSSCNNQHVQGKYNLDSSTSAFIIGNGTNSSNKSNAFEVEWTGDTYVHGSLCTIKSPTRIADYTRNGLTSIVASIDNSGVVTIDFKQGETVLETKTYNMVSGDTGCVIAVAAPTSKRQYVPKGETFSVTFSYSAAILTIDSCKASIIDDEVIDGYGNKLSDILNKVSKSGDVIDGTLTVKGYKTDSTVHTSTNVDHNDVRFHSFAYSNNAIQFYYGTWTTGETPEGTYQYNVVSIQNVTRYAAIRFINTSNDEVVYTLELDAQNLPTATLSDPLIVELPSGVTNPDLYFSLRADTVIDGNGIRSESLGTAAAKNVPASGDAASTEVVMGNDTRLSDSRNLQIIKVVPSGVTSLFDLPDGIYMLTGTTASALTDYPSSLISGRTMVIQATNSGYKICMLIAMSDGDQYNNIVIGRGTSAYAFYKAALGTGTAATKNITISTTDLTPGSSALTTGDIYMVYEA